MPKYFSGDREVLFEIAKIDAGALNAANISLLFRDVSERSVCVTFSGFDQSCLGYIAHIRKNGDTFDLLNICSELELRVDGIDALVTVLAHVCGARYSAAVQAVFQQIRNDIGSASHAPIFAG